MEIYGTVKMFLWCKTSLPHFNVVTFSVSQARKTLLVPTPRLRSGLFNRIVPPAGATKEILRICSTSRVGTQNGQRLN